MDFYRQLGELIFGTRLRRLSDRFLVDVGKVYRYLDIDFEPSWFSTFYCLDEKGEVSVTELADALAITHQSVGQLVTILERKGVIKILRDNQDKRKRLIVFTQKGKNLVDRIKPVWNSIDAAMRKTLAEGANSVYLLQALDEFEDAMKRQTLYSRIIEEIETRQVENINIIQYDAEYKRQFKNLMLSWLIGTYDSDILDVSMLNHPKKKVINEGGLILLARVHDEIIGTIVVESQDKASANILYLVVDSNWQKKGVGRKLLREAINQLQQQKAKKIRIELDRKSTHALRLIKGSGFKAVVNDDDSQNANGTKLPMELSLETNKQNSRGHLKSR